MKINTKVKMKLSGSKFSTTEVSLAHTGAIQIRLLLIFIFTVFAFQTKGKQNVHCSSYEAGVYFLVNLLTHSCDRRRPLRYRQIVFHTSLDCRGRRPHTTISPGRSKIGQKFNIRACKKVMPQQVSSVTEGFLLVTFLEK